MLTAQQLQWPHAAVNSAVSAGSQPGVLGSESRGERIMGQRPQHGHRQSQEQSFRRGRVTDAQLSHCSLVLYSNHVSVVQVTIEEDNALVHPTRDRAKIPHGRRLPTRGHLMTVVLCPFIASPVLLSRRNFPAAPLILVCSPSGVLLPRVADAGPRC